LTDFLKHPLSIKEKEGIETEKWKDRLDLVGLEG